MLCKLKDFLTYKSLKMLIKAAETITTGMSGSISLKLLVTSTCHFSKEFHHFVQNEKRIASLLPGRLYIVHVLREHLDPAPPALEIR